MRSDKLPMSASYKAVFALSIAMLILVIVGGALSRSKTFGIAVWYWGYIIWQMYKRNDEALVSFQKTMLWIEAICFFVGIVIFYSSNSNAKQFMGEEPNFYLVLAGITLGITYFLYKFFLSQVQIGTSSFSQISRAKVDDRFWEKALTELEGQRHDATWAKALVNSDGDELKAKAQYLLIRASNLREIESQLVIGSSVQTSFFGGVISKIKSFILSLNAIEIAILIIPILIIISDLNKQSQNADLKNSVAPSENLSNSPSSNDLEQPNIGAKILVTSIENGVTWEDAVEKFQDGIERRVVSVHRMNAQLITNPLEIFDKPNHKNGIQLSETMVSIAELKNIWWVENNKFYIRFFNPSKYDLIGFNMLFFAADCENRKESAQQVSFDFSGEPLSAYSFGIYSSDLPFDFSATLGDGKKCGIVTMALGK